MKEALSNFRTHISIHCPKCSKIEKINTIVIQEM